MLGGVNAQAQTLALRRLATRLAVDDEDDLVQDVWEDALRSPPQDQETPGRWLRVVLRNRRVSNHRATTRRRAREEHAPAPTPIPSAEQIQLARELLDQVDALPAKDRDLLVLRYWEGASLQECAERLGLSPSTVRSRHARALAKLRHRLDDKGGGREAWLAALAPWVRAPLAASRSTGSAFGLGTISLGGLCAATMLWLASMLDPACGVDEDTNVPDERTVVAKTTPDPKDKQPPMPRPRDLRGHVALGAVDEAKHPCDSPISPDDSSTLAELVQREEAPTHKELAIAFAECTMKHGPPGEYSTRQTGPGDSTHPLLSSAMSLRHVWAAMRHCHTSDDPGRARIAFIIRLEADRTMLVRESMVVDSEGLDDDVRTCIANTVYVAEVGLRPGDATMLDLPEATVVDFPFLVEIELHDNTLEIVGSGFFPSGAVVYDKPEDAASALAECGVDTFDATLGWDPETRALDSVAFEDTVPNEARLCLRTALDKHLQPVRRRFFPRTDDETRRRCTFEPDERPECENPTAYEVVAGG